MKGWKIGGVVLLVAAGVVLGMGACEKRPTGWELSAATGVEGAVDTQEMTEGIYPVGSLIKDGKALGGFGPCDNYPFALGGKGWGEAGKVSVVAFSSEVVGRGSVRGFAVRVVNRTGKTVGFEASDSRLMMVREARDGKGEWRAVEGLPLAYCGNSFHRVFLRNNEYWQMAAPEYAGAEKTRMRFRLKVAEGEALVYSNEFEGSVNSRQFLVESEGMK